MRLVAQDQESVQPAIGQPERERPVSGKGLLDGIELVVFDKDGTLIEFHAMWGGWVADLAGRLESATGLAVKEPLFQAMGYEAASGRTLAGAPLAITPMPLLRELTVGVLRDAGASAADAKDAVARSWRAPDPLTLARPLADLRGLFRTLRQGGRRIAVATTDDRVATESTLAGLGVAPLVDAIVCADDGLAVKPAPAMVLELCARLGIEPARAAVIGDAPADLAMARAAGAGRSIGVLSGVGTRADLEPLADAVIPSVGNLFDD